MFFDWFRGFSSIFMFFAPELGLANRALAGEKLEKNRFWWLESPKTNPKWSQMWGNYVWGWLGWFLVVFFEKNSIFGWFFDDFRFFLKNQVEKKPLFWSSFFGARCVKSGKTREKNFFLPKIVFFNYFHLEIPQRSFRTHQKCWKYVHYI